MDSNIIIDSLGGTNEVARLCEVSAQAVSQWRTDGIPHARLMYLKLARPEIFVATATKLGTGETAKEAA